MNTDFPYPNTPYPDVFMELPLAALNQWNRLVKEPLTWGGLDRDEMLRLAELNEFRTLVEFMDKASPDEYQCATFGGVAASLGKFTDAVAVLNRIGICFVDGAPQFESVGLMIAERLEALPTKPMGSTFALTCQQERRRLGKPWTLRLGPVIVREDNVLKRYFPLSVVQLHELVKTTLNQCSIEHLMSADSSFSITKW